MKAVPRLVAGVACAAAVTAFAPAVASAHSIVRVSGGELSYVSFDATSLNSLTGRVAGEDFDLRDPTVDGGIDPGPCRPGAISDDGNAYIVQVLCRRSTITRVRVDLADREDTADLDLPVPIAILGGSGADVLRTGPVADRLEGGDGNDTLAGGAGGDVLVGGPGRDRLEGGDGDDLLVGGRDDRIIDGGAGNDLANLDFGDHGQLINFLVSHHRRR